MKRQKSFDEIQPTVYLVATPIGNLDEFTPRAIEILQSVDVIAAEDTRNTMKLLTHFNIHTRLIAHHQHNEQASSKGLVQLLEEGKSIAIVSDAGYPLISDPGQTIVDDAINAGYPVVPISGANAMLNALVASGISAQPFMFYGFLKTQEKERTKELLQLRDYPYTLIFYEAPHRIKKMLESLFQVFKDRKITLARELTKRHEEFIRGNISEILPICDSLKGEMVIVVEGNQSNERDVISTIPIQEQIQQHINEGLSSKEAIKRVAKTNGLSKNDLYKEFHGLN